LKGQSFYKRVGFALCGLKMAARREKSFRTHLVAAAAVLIVLYVTQPGIIWWTIIALTVGFVLVTELLNTAFETLADQLCPEEHSEIGAAKDIAAGAVLVASLIGIIVGLVFILNWIGI